jgi:lipopolysaccharide transport system permease protein
LVLALRDLRLRYKQTFLGVAWAAFQPLAALAIFSVVFGRLAGLPSDGIPYPAFVYAGLAAWFYFSNAIAASAESLAGDRELVTKVYFPRVLAPLGSVLAGLVDLVVSLVAVAVIVIAYSITPGYAIALLPLWLVALVVFAFAVALWLSALNVLYRDVRYALGFAIQLWLFVSPVVFPSSLVEDGWRYVFALNPVAGLIDGLRWSLLDGPAPGPEALVSLISGACVLAGGLLFFHRAERRFADRI